MANCHCVNIQDLIQDFDAINNGAKQLSLNGAENRQENQREEVSEEEVC